MQELLCRDYYVEAAKQELLCRDYDVEAAKQELLCRDYDVEAAMERAFPGMGDVFYHGSFCAQTFMMIAF